jgi:hypothetical protein
MRKKLIVGLATLNGVLALALFAAPAAGTQVMAAFALRDCCEIENGEPICCDSCCWFINDCDGGEDCGL